MKKLETEDSEETHFWTRKIAMGKFTLAADAEEDPSRKWRFTDWTEAVKDGTERGRKSMAMDLEPPTLGMSGASSLFTVLGEVGADPVLRSGTNMDREGIVGETGLTEARDLDVWESNTLLDRGMTVPSTSDGEGKMIAVFPSKANA